MNSEEKKILVYYLSIAGIRSEDVEDFMILVKDKIISNTVSDNSEIIFIPVQSETRIECINPKYITDSELIKKHERLMSELHEHLNHQIENIKNNG